MSRPLRPAMGVLSMMAIAIAACGDEPRRFTQVDTPTHLDDLCPSDVEMCPEEGATRCIDGKLQTCREAVFGCLGWGEASSCPLNQACVTTRCEEVCPEALCGVAEARRCEPGTVDRIERCADTDGDGCLGWVAAGACAGAEVCSQGACAAECVDECAADGERCEAGGVVTCADHDGDGCLEWGARSACEGACVLGACVAECRDECGAAGLTRCDGPAVETCEAGPDGCLHWGVPVACPAGASCSFGACAAACSDECVTGAKSCEAGGVVICGEHDRDPCTDRGLPAACPEGESCSGGACDRQCDDECTSDGARSCDTAGKSVRVCRQGDADPCLEWVIVENCDGVGDSCSNGACAAACSDECEAAAVRCEAGSATRVETCDDGDADPCLEWVAGRDCADEGMVCAEGRCAASCTDECAGPSCDGDAVVDCGEHDGDPCKDRGTARACEAGTTCDVGVCVAAPAPAGVKIAEVLYQSEGPDDDTFVELGGPPGTALAGFALIAVNGADGVEYARYPLGGALDGGGRYVIVHPGADPAIRDWGDAEATFVDLQNGPDNLVLVWGAGDTVRHTIDALGYGAFAPGDHFTGEGDPAPDAPAGVSLARIGDLQDTGDNEADFALAQVPTPGRPYEAAARPTHHGDVIVTELMIDPQARPDTAGEWVELYNPTASTWQLEGCFIVSDPAEEHEIGDSLLVGPGRRVVLARSADPGFSPAYVYAGIQLAQGDDSIALYCADEMIDLITWVGAPAGKSRSLDADRIDAIDNDAADAWCAAPLDGVDAGTPGAPNPPCPDHVGFYDETALDSEWGSCDPSPDWQYFTFSGAPAAAGDGELGFEWWAVLCELFADRTAIEVELRTGADWTPVGDASFDTEDESCAWHAESLAIDEAVIDEARALTSEVEGRFRIAAGCPGGVGCGVLGLTLPYNCGRAFTLTYPY